MKALYKILFLIVLIFFISGCSLLTKDKEEIYCAKNWEDSYPQDWIKFSEVEWIGKIYDTDTITMHKESIRISDLNGSGSMRPFFNGKENYVLYIPYNNESLKIGDIIVYNNTKKNIIHSVCNVLEDDEGVYYVMRGYHNMIADNIKVRTEMIKNIVVGVIF